MSINVLLNGTTYSIPEAGERGWSSLTDYLVALATNTITPSDFKLANRVAIEDAVSIFSNDTVVLLASLHELVTITLPSFVSVDKEVILIDQAGKQRLIVVNGESVESFNSIITLYYDGTNWNIKSVVRCGYSKASDAHTICVRDNNGNLPIDTFKSHNNLYLPAGDSASRVSEKAVLRYNTELDKLEFYDGAGWKIIEASAAGGMVLNDLLDVIAPTPSVNDTLAWNGTNWVPASGVHNSLVGLNDGDYKHLTQAQYTSATREATASQNGLMSSVYATKLDGIDTNANNYVHPTNHPPSIITQDINNRFVSDSQITNWNGKANDADVVKLAGDQTITGTKTYTPNDFILKSTFSGVSNISAIRFKDSLDELQGSVGMYSSSSKDFMVGSFTGSLHLYILAGSSIIAPVAPYVNSSSILNAGAMDTRYAQLANTNSFTNPQTMPTTTFALAGQRSWAMGKLENNNSLFISQGTDGSGGDGALFIYSSSTDGYAKRVEIDQGKISAPVATYVNSNSLLNAGAMDIRYQLLSGKGAANGYCPLNGSAKIDPSYLSSTPLVFKGTWNASTNTPALATPDTARKGEMYNVTVAGTNLGFTWSVGDQLIYDDTGAVTRTPNVQSVTSVNGLQGDVVLSTSNILEGTNLYYTDTRARASVSGSGVISYSSSTGVVGHTDSSTVRHVTDTEKSTWNGKENAITAGTTAHYYRGDKSFVTLNTAAVPESGNLYYTDTRARSAINASGVITYNSGTGAIAHTDSSTVRHVTDSQITNWNGKANDADVVKLAGEQIITGTKTYTPNDFILKSTFSGVSNISAIRFKDSLDELQGSVGMYSSSSKDFMVGSFTGNLHLYILAGSSIIAPVAPYVNSSSILNAGAMDSRYPRLSNTNSFTNMQTMPTTTFALAGQRSWAMGKLENNNSLFISQGTDGSGGDGALFIYSSSTDGYAKRVEIYQGKISAPVATRVDGTSILNCDNNDARYAPKSFTYNGYSSATKTLVQDDNNKVITNNDATNTTITVPQLAAGTVIHVTRLTSGTVTFVTGSGVTIYSVGNNKKLRAAGSGATLLWLNTTDVQLIGDLAP